MSMSSAVSSLHMLKIVVITVCGVWGLTVWPWPIEIQEHAYVCLVCPCLIIIMWLGMCTCACMRSFWLDVARTFYHGFQKGWKYLLVF